MPRRHELHLQHADPASLDAMGRAIRDAVAHLEAAIGDVAYNLGFHTAPHEHSGRVPLARPPVAEPRHPGRVRAGHRRDDQRHAPERAADDAARRPHAGLTTGSSESAAITVSADYAVTPEQLWAVLEPIERHVDWMADAESIEFLTAEHRGVGTRFVCVTKVGPIRLPRRAWRSRRGSRAAMGVRHDGLVTGDGRFTLEPLDERPRTRFTWTEELTRPVVARRAGRRPASAVAR